jgi:hypothetical protein
VVSTRALIVAAVAATAIASSAAGFNPPGGLPPGVRESIKARVAPRLAYAPTWVPPRWTYLGWGERGRPGSPALKIVYSPTRPRSDGEPQVGPQQLLPPGAVLYVSDLTGGVCTHGRPEYHFGKIAVHVGVDYYQQVAFRCVTWKGRRLEITVDYGIRAGDANTPTAKRHLYELAKVAAFMRRIP